jgi:hypothetical protein
MTHALARVLPAVASIALVASLAACGGGGGGGDVVPGPAPATSLSGNVVKGPVSGATVTAYSIAAGMMGTPLGTAVTDAQGGFAMPMANASGPVMLQMAGGTYTDEATGAKVTLAPGQVMTAVLSSLAGGTASVQVTPLTAMAQAMAAGMPGGMTAANIDAANAAVGAYFMIGDIVHTRPLNPLVSGSGVGAAAPMANYGIALAAMAQYAKNAGVSSSAFVGSMMQDAADGVLDGKAGSAPIAMGPGMMAGGGMMQAGAGGTGLAAAMGDFMGSPSNASGLTAASMTQLMQHLTAGGGRLR